MARAQPERPQPKAQRAFGHLLRGVTLVVGGLMLASIAINFANVVARRVFSSPFIWAEEAMIYIMVWLVFVGAILVTWDGGHLKMDILSTSLRGRARRAVNLLAVAAVFAACLFVAFNSYTVFELMVTYRQLSNAAGIPMAIPHGAILLGFAVMLVAILVRLRFHLAGGAPLRGPEDTDAGEAPTPDSDGAGG